MKPKHTLPDGTVLIRGDKHKSGNVLDGEQHEDDPFPKRLTAAEKLSTPRLTSGERKHWQQALKTIDKGWKVVVEVGLALEAIRDSRLFREDYDSWEAFCREVVGMSKTEANRQIIDAEVVMELQAPNGVSSELDVLPPPENRAQVRALSKVKDPEERRKVWQEVAAESGEKRITAQAIKEAIKPQPPHVNRSPTQTGNRANDKAPSDSVIAGLGILETLLMARGDGDWTLVDSVIRHLEEQEE